MLKQRRNIAIIPLLLGAQACCVEYETAECGVAPDVPLEGFMVTTTTGSDASDADIYFCVEFKDGQERCEELSGIGDDFDAHETDEYMISLSVEPGQLAGFYVHNRGGAPFDNRLGLTDGNDWSLAGLRIQGLTSDGRALKLYDEPEICSSHLEASDRYRPMGCVY